MKQGPVSFLFTAFLFFFVHIRAGNELEPAGARAGAMGQASVCLSDAWSSFNNQAGLAFVRSPEVSAYSTTPFLIPELKLAAFALVLPSRSATWALTVSDYGYSLYRENKFGIAYARTLGKNISAGLQLDYLHTVIGENYGSTNLPLAEFGIQAKLIRGLKLGIHLYNPTRARLAAYSDERALLNLRSGLLYEVSSRVLITLEAEKDNVHEAVFKAGLEYYPRKEIIIRAGASDKPGTVCFGFGLITGNIRLDLSSSWQSLLGFTPSASLSYSFQKQK